MYTMILLLYLQQGLDVTLDQANLRGQYLKQDACETAARRLRGPVPIPRNYSAAWQDVMCIKVNNNVRVNGMKPIDLSKALQAYAPCIARPKGHGNGWPSCAARRNSRAMARKEEAATGRPGRHGARACLTDLRAAIKQLSPQARR
ncbi:hypothetical protein [Massilia sp. CT11-137]|uniref:hypothetical protein n=1 Tax=Massilia sp. CT11-137 TaxID=3393901 RepID=UPI0039AEEBBF